MGFLSKLYRKLITGVTGCSKGKPASSSLKGKLELPPLKNKNKKSDKNLLRNNAIKKSFGVPLLYTKYVTYFISYSWLAYQHFGL